MREPVVSQIAGLVTDRLDDHREDRDRKHERREQQVQLRDRPDGHAASDDRKRSVRGLFVGFVLGLFLRGRLLGGLGLGADGRGLRRLLVLAAPRGHRHGARKHHEAGDWTEKDQQRALCHRAFLNG